MSERVTGGDVVAAFLEAAGVRVAFGVISIHNMPILDAIVRRGVIRCVPARGEAGATNMADAYARVTGSLGVAFTSTGTAAGNACGALVEALTAGTPLLHVTGQIDVPYLDRERSYIHEAKDQLAMLRAVSKRAFRVWSADTLLGTLREAAAVALTPPAGPVSIEIPIDVQGALMDWPPFDELLPLPPAEPLLDVRSLEALARELRGAKRPLLWLGGGARGAVAPVRALANLGFGVVTSANGRGVLPEDDPHSLGSYTTAPPVEALYRTCDAMVVAGSRLRGNETLRWNVQLPEKLYQIDVDPAMRDRSYAVRRFVTGDAATALGELVELLGSDMRIDPGFGADIVRARTRANDELRRTLGPYEPLVDALGAWMPANALWVRDVTVSNSSWGNRYLPLRGPRDGVHALGGGIGQGLPMAIGAALGAGERKTVALAGDGGLQLSLGEFATLVQEDADVLLIVMNDGGYGVIRNIQDAQYGARRCLADLHTPDFQTFAASIGLRSARVTDGASFTAALADLGNRRGPALLEVDMLAIGPYATAFAGPPVREASSLRHPELVEGPR
jgi:acetolactate synthase-1/2/3 large subunit